MLSDLTNKMKKDLDERGYSLAEMKEVGERIQQDKRNWIRHFDQYIEHILYDDSSKPSALIIKQAAELATLRDIAVLDKFGEGEDD